ncbi:M20 family metallo-hydrolase [Pseudonocardia humida]|uniref:M20 family metallo-hydrolase n=1 Tax=Pseudonocardia humida TaxID=2800819 RepID=A0ABT1ABU9_9PSEU|nr:M20 family metallo-hydrolase [Pseudonocardia humida]MCO1660504.1 M20 family metallo-hydrolase [Pseudonocardia humida]
MSHDDGSGWSAAAFLRDFAQLSTIGATPRGGVDREAATVRDGMARAWLGGWLASRGFAVAVDGIGNQFGLLDLVPGAPYVLAGSHLDSQPTAGRLDGAYGVVAAAFAAHRVAAGARAGTVRPTRNLAVVNWFNEEGSRFGPSMMGSAVFTGRLDADEALRTTDPAGVTVRDALDGIDGRGGPVPLPVGSYAEIHIEQGRELEETGDRIGVVTGTWAARKFRFRVLGEQSHTGSTRMADRRDALLGASLLVVEARSLADRFAEAPLHTAVSQLDVRPNSPVVVAAEVRANLDLRSPDPAVLDAAVHRLRDVAARVEAERGLRVELELTHSWDRDDYTPECVAVSERVCAELGVPARRMLTVAGHDSTNMAKVVPTAMLFVPSREGISHNEREDTAPDDLVTGVDVLTGVVRELVTAPGSGPDRQPWTPASTG